MKVLLMAALMAVIAFIAVAWMASGFIRPGRER
jgi:hypothetical protein